MANSSYWRNFKGQLRPPSDLWVNALHRCEDCEDLWALAEGLRVRLSRYRRGTHRGYFEWYCSLYADVPEDDAAADQNGRTKLANHVLLAREQLRWDGSCRGVHVVMSNRKRKLLNKRCNELQRRERANSVYVE